MVRVVIVGAIIVAVGLTILLAADVGIPSEISGPIVVLAAWSARNSRRRENQQAF